MKLHIFTEQELNDYSSYVLANDQATAYHLPSWGKAVENSYGFKPLYFGLLDADKIVAVLPAVKMKNLRGRNLLSALPYCDLGNILADSTKTKTHLLELVVDYATSHNLGFEYRDTHAYVPKPDTAVNDSSEPSTELKDGAKVRMLYELQTDTESQLAFFKPKLRSQIKKAAKNGITARVVNTPQSNDIKAFYEVFSINMKDLGSPVHSIDWFIQIFEQYNRHSFLVLAEYEGKCIGGGIVIHTNDAAVIPWASTLRDFNKLAPNMLLYWEVLCEVIRRGMFKFDFGRSSFNEGTYRFKKQWGASPLLLEWKYLHEGELKHEAPSKPSNIRSLVERTWMKLPIRTTQMLGPKIRKYISL